MDKQNKSEAFLKVDTFSNKSVAKSLLLKSDDVIVALENNMYFKGENALIEDLNLLKKENKKAILTIYRNGKFFDIIITSSLGCKFISTDSEETKLISKNFSKKEVFDMSELKEFIAMRDLTHNFEILSKSKSLAAGLFPPLWLSYHRKWWLLSVFTILSFLLIVINFWFFVFGWVCVSVYCYNGQLELLVSFSRLSGKAHSLILAAPNIDIAQLIVRNLNPKAKFLVSKLDDPVDEDIIDKSVENPENKISDSQEALV